MDGFRTDFFASVVGGIRHRACRTTAEELYLSQHYERDSLLTFTRVFAIILHRRIFQDDACVRFLKAARLSLLRRSIFRSPTTADLPHRLTRMHGSLPHTARPLAPAGSLFQRSRRLDVFTGTRFTKTVQNRPTHSIARGWLLVRGLMLA